MLTRINNTKLRTFYKDPALALPPFPLNNW